MILSDNETKVDLLNNEAIAKTIVMLLRERPEHPVTIGVHGDWGAGKSSVLEMIEAALNAQDRVLCLKFNGWRFQGFEDAKIALIEGIVTGLLEKRPALTKAGAAVKDIFHRIDWLKVAKKAGGLALAAYAGLPALGVQALVGTLEGLFADPAKLATKENLDAALFEAKGLLKPDGETKNVPEEIAAFRKAFDDLLNQAGIDQLVVLIDDLDRCLPDTAIETLEAVRLFVFTSRTAFVVAADEAMIEYAVRKHFPDLPDTTGPRYIRTETSGGSAVTAKRETMQLIRQAIRRLKEPMRGADLNKVLGITWGGNFSCQVLPRHWQFHYPLCEHLPRALPSEGFALSPAGMIPKNAEFGWFCMPICQVLLQKNLPYFRGAPILSTWEDAPHRQKAQVGS